MSLHAIAAFIFGLAMFPAPAFAAICPVNVSPVNLFVQLPQGQAITPFRTVDFSKPLRNNCFDPTINYSADGLPSGLSIDAETGVISGSVTAVPAGAQQRFDVNIKLFNVGESLLGGVEIATFYDNNLIIIVKRKLESRLNSFDLNGTGLLLRAGSNNSKQPVEAVFGTGPFSWSVSPALPSGLSLNSSTGEISGTPSPADANLAGTSHVIKITDIGSNVGAFPDFDVSEQTINVILEPALETTISSSIPQLVNGIAVSPFQPVTATGGVGTITYALSGPLPQGLTFNTANGEISGTPNSQFPGSSRSFSVTATDSAGFSSSKDFMMVLDGAVAFQKIATQTLTSGDPDAFNNFTPVLGSSSRGAVTYSISPALPTGLTLNASTGEITGSPTARIGATEFTVTVTDMGSPPSTGSQNFNLTVMPADPVIRTITPTAGSNAGGSIVTVTGSNFGPRFADSTLVTLAGTAVQNITFAPDGSSLSFTVPPLPGFGGFHKVRIENVDNPNPAEILFRLQPALEVSSVVDQIFSVGEAVSTIPVFITEGSGAGTVSWSLIGALPQGLSFNTATGEISGTPIQQRVATQHIITVTDQDVPPAVVERQFSITVVSTITLNVAQPVVSIRPGEMVNVIPVAAIGGVNPISYALSSPLPAGLSFNSATGAITGTLTRTAPIDTRFGVTVTDSSRPDAAVATADFRLIVDAIAVSVQPPYELIYISNSSAPETGTTTPISVSNGTAPYSYSISPSLPNGLILDPATGTISGAPVQRIAKTDHIITITDSATQARTATATIPITVRAADPTITSVSQIDIPDTGGTPISVVGSNFGSNFADATNIAIDGVPVTNLVIAADGNSMTFTTSAKPSTGTSSSSTQGLVISNEGGFRSAQTSMRYFTLEPIFDFLSSSELEFFVGVGNRKATLFAKGGLGNLTYSIRPATLPAGLSFESSTGDISGTPTSLFPVTNYTVTATDEADVRTNGVATAQTFDHNFTLEVNTAPPPAGTPTFSSITPNSFSAAGGTTVIIVGSGFTPQTNFRFDGRFSESKTVSGDGLSATVVTPLGTAGVTDLRIANPTGSPVTATGAITYVARPDSTITSANTKLIFEIGKPITDVTPMVVTGGIQPLSYSADNLPAGLSYDAATGLLSGTPTELVALGNGAGRLAVFTATDVSTPVEPKTTRGSNISVLAPLEVAVANPTVVLQPTELVTPFTPVTATNGFGFGYSGDSARSYALVGTTLPTGLIFSASTGEITGTPTATFAPMTVTVEVTDDGSGTGFAPETKSMTFQLEVQPVLTATKATDVSVSVGETVNVTPVTGSGGVGDLTFALSAPLPAGLAFNPSTGAVTGSPVEPVAPANYDVTVTDSARTPVSSTITISLEVTVAAPQITSVTPNEVSSANGTTIRISGTGFRLYPSLPGVFDVGISLGGQTIPIAFNRISDTEITATTPSAVSGLANVFVQLPQGRSANTAADDINFVALSDITSTITSPTNLVTGPFEVEITFSEAVSRFDASNLALTNASLISFSGAGDTYFATLQPSSEGAITVGANVNSAKGTALGTRVGNIPSLQLVFRTTMADVTFFSQSGAEAIGGTSVRITFSEDVDDFTIEDLIVNAGTTVADLRPCSSSSKTCYQFGLSRATDGVAMVSLRAGAVKDRFGLTLDVSGSFSIVIDNTVPVLTISGPPYNVIQTQDFQIIATFSEDVTGFDASRISSSGGIDVTNVAAIIPNRSFSITLSPRFTSQPSFDFSLFNVRDAAGNIAVWISRPF